MFNDFIWQRALSHIFDWSQHQITLILFIRTNTSVDDKFKLNENHIYKFNVLIFHQAIYE